MPYLRMSPEQQGVVAPRTLEHLRELNRVLSQQGQAAAVELKDSIPSDERGKYPYLIAAADDGTGCIVEFMILHYVEPERSEQVVVRRATGRGAGNGLRRHAIWVHPGDVAAFVARRGQG